MQESLDFRTMCWQFQLKRRNRYLTVVLLHQHNHFHAAAVLAVTHKEFFYRFSWSNTFSLAPCTGNRETQQNPDTYVTMGAEPHSAASSKSWIERSVQQSIITRKCRSQRLRVSCETQQSGRQPLVQVLARQTRTAERMGLTSVSKINRRLSTTTIFLTPLKLSQDVNREKLNNQLSGYSACQNVLQHIYSSSNHIHSSKLYLVMRTVFNMSSITKKSHFEINLYIL